ncbi:MAG: phage BR0599 family protein [Stenotrophomonas sp.]|uniref:phage BR0599 family protein n=1 Tax=Stenotrophomonas sp. TaxID=69392 RepID=UPI003D6C720D
MSLFARHVELYEFGRGSERWRYTSGDRTEVFNNQIFTPAALKRGRLAQSSQESRANLEITVPLTLPLLSVLRPYPPTERITVQYRKVRRSDGAVRGTWNGILGDTTERQNDAILSCQTFASAEGMNGLRRCWQVSCPFTLYDSDCGVVPSAFRVDTTLFGTTVTSITATVFGDKPNGWFDGGYIMWKRGTATEYRFITSHVGTKLTLLTASPLKAGDLVAVFPGCGHSLGVCHEKFNNAPNYGGQHTLPKKNPFGADPIF